ncbi:hypothetical protein AJ79_07428 [Helicocarpus griseus UAMH5409]|uniref:Ribosome biogenesis protein Alb1 n=1 Tax=Helicocarpus griseus UAMH5409 TaxID=1447875 RepID=A0A2B7X376_9EURO|nr:hypothetical protein AJ79_07428 [Helicocarpus griseus UAMH5409]
MARTAKPKAKAGAKSIHSRAAKRAASPSLDADKSLASVPRPEPTATVKPHILSAQHNSGINKKSKPKHMTRAQKRRQEKGLERAELVMDRTEKKVAKSVGRGKTVQARRATWEELNQKVLAAQSKTASTAEGMEDDADAMDEDDSKATSTRPATEAPKASTIPQKPALDETFEFEQDGEIT